MALRELNILNDCIEAISNQSLILDINNKAFLDDIQTLLVQYFETFNKVLNEMEYDNFSVDFFVDYGKLIIYPEKKMPEDLIYMFILDIFIISIIIFFYKQILAVSYDSEFASLRGINVKFFYTLILILAALCVVAAIKAVGLILVIALLTIPTYLAENFASRLSTMMIISSFLATIFTILGLVVSYVYDISSGASIILVAVVVLGLVKLIKFKK